MGVKCQLRCVNFSAQHADACMTFTKEKVLAQTPLQIACDLE